MSYGKSLVLSYSRARRRLHWRFCKCIADSGIHVPEVSPDYLCIGAPRTGTTWLHGRLMTHSDVFLPRSKEIHFFDERPLDGEQFFPELFNPTSPVDRRWYYLQFRKGVGKIKVDITPTYAVVSRKRIHEIAQMMPKLKIIYIIRDPVERAWSGVGNFMYKKHRVNVNNVDEGKLTDIVMMEGRLRHGKYRQIIEGWEMYFKGRINYVFFDDIQNAPSEVLSSVCEYLGVDVKMIPDEVMTKKKMNSDYPKLEMPGNIRKLLTEYYQEDTEFIKSKFNRELSHWTGKC